MLSSLLALLFAVSPALLAPGPQELAEATSVLRRHLVEADAIARAEARIHNGLAGSLALGQPLCGDDVSRSLLARSQAFGQAYRDAVQTARADAGRLRRLLAEPTLEPILRPERRAQIEAGLKPL